MITAMDVVWACVALIVGTGLALIVDGVITWVNDLLGNKPEE